MTKGIWATVAMVAAMVSAVACSGDDEGVGEDDQPIEGETGGNENDPVVGCADADEGLACANPGTTCEEGCNECFFDCNAEGRWEWVCYDSEFEPPCG